MTCRRHGWSLALLGLLALNAQGQEKSWTEPLTGMVFVALPKACFQMGTSAALVPSGLSWERMGFKGSLSADEVPQHEVCLGAFWMARHEVRWSDWQTVMGAGEVGADGSRPVIGVSWEQARAFAERLSALAGTPQLFRLPTEAQWEYACRAGRKEASDLPRAEVFDMAWYSAGMRSLAASAPVATLKPNAWGLFDLLGNVWEWTVDGYRADAYARHGLFNPVIAAQERQRVIRGGSHRSEENQVRCGNRAFYAQDETLPQIGFRLVLSRELEKKKGEN